MGHVGDTPSGPLLPDVLNGRAHRPHDDGVYGSDRCTQDESHETPEAAPREGSGDSPGSYPAPGALEEAPEALARGEHTPQYLGKREAGEQENRPGRSHEDGDPQAGFTHRPPETYGDDRPEVSPSFSTGGGHKLTASRILEVHQDQARHVPEEDARHAGPEAKRLADKEEEPEEQTQAWQHDRAPPEPLA
jgi:hypothetical protein